MTACNHEPRVVCDTRQIQQARLTAPFMLSAAKQNPVCHRIAEAKGDQYNQLCTRGKI